jgi:membrane protease YdiL (CAAX protease family)
MLKSLAQVMVYGAAIVGIRYFTRPGRGLLAGAGRTEWPYQVADSAIYLAAVLLTTAIACRALNKKSLKSLGLDLSVRDAKFGVGGLVQGTLLMSFIFFTALAMGWVRVLGVQKDDVTSNMLVAFALNAAIAINEEVIFRGYIFQRLAAGFGVNPATLVSAILFAAVHTTNPNASLWSVLPLTVPGLLLVTQYRATRSLWMPIGFHLAWNVFEGPIYGFALSGVEGFSLLKISIQGPAEFVGGEFGPEGALLGTLASLIGFGILWLWSRRKAGDPAANSIGVRKGVV